jgi:hypothetical protein
VAGVNRHLLRLDIGPRSELSINRFSQLYHHAIGQLEVIHAVK